MLHFQPIRTRRLSVRLREIPMDDAIRLCSIAAERHETMMTEFLRCAIAEAKAPSPNHVTDPQAWTVQERIWAVVSYLCVLQDGDVNFTVGDDQRLSDFLLSGKDTPKAPVKLGTIGGDEWTMKPLIGIEAEIIELLIAESQSQIPGSENKTGMYLWTKGAMAAQLHRTKDETPPDPMHDFQGYCIWLRRRMAEFGTIPESDFSALLDAFWTGQDELGHFFNITFDDQGIVALPTKKMEADGVIPSARFPASSCISDLARRYSGKPHQSGNKPGNTFSRGITPRRA